MRAVQPGNQPVVVIARLIFATKDEHRVNRTRIEHARRIRPDLHAGRRANRAAMRGIQAQLVTIRECGFDATQLIRVFEYRSQLAHLHNGKSIKQKHDYAFSLTADAHPATTAHVQPRSRYVRH
ncbi:hypothetical protein [Burkholderia sp. Ac-20353]|uniref:hypothetical protein n=1 Tax=Burkholderia sp. Ac-20353 TaxID=2703894 RepID=UPI001F11E871|nr:hypothetical protein [Burkholderia sp. Ac-20353]